MELCTLVQKIEIKNVFLHCSQRKQPTLISLDYITTAPPPNLTRLLQKPATQATKTATNTDIARFRDGPLENLWGGEGGRSTKKNIRAREN